MVKTKTDKSKIDLAGVDWGEKMLEMLDEEGWAAAAEVTPSASVKNGRLFRAIVCSVRIIAPIKIFFSVRGVNVYNYAALSDPEHPKNVGFSNASFVVFGSCDKLSPRPRHVCAGVASCRASNRISFRSCSTPDRSCGREWILGSNGCGNTQISDPAGWSLSP